MDAIEAEIERVRGGTTGGAEFLTRNLHVALRDETPALPDDRLYEALQPYLTGLLTLAALLRRSRIMLKLGRLDKTNRIFL